MGKSQPSAPPARRVREKTKQSAIEKKHAKKDKKAAKAVIQKGKTVKKPENKHTKKEIKNATNTRTGASASKKDAKPKKEEKIAKQVQKTSAKSQSKVVAKPKNENKETEDKPKRPSALRKAPTTPVANNRGVARGTSASASLDGCSVDSSGALKVDELEELQKAEKRAAALGVSLDEYLTSQSEKALEDHMKQVMRENEGSKTDHEGSEEEGSNEDDEPASESSEEEDQEEEEEKSEPPSPLCLEDGKEDESEEDGSESETDSSSSSGEEKHGQEPGAKEKKDGKEKAPESKVTEVVGVSNNVDAGARKALENSILIFLEQNLPFLFVLK